MAFNVAKSAASNDFLSSQPQIAQVVQQSLAALAQSNMIRLSAPMAIRVASTNPNANGVENPLFYVVFRFKTDSFVKAITY